MIGRREVLTSTGALGLAMFSGAATAEACTVLATQRPVAFDDDQCRHSIGRWVSLLNNAPGLDWDDLQRQVDEASVDVVDDMLRWEVLLDGVRDAANREYLFVKQFRLSGGQLDPRPIRLIETNRIRRLGNRATYQFTLERYRFVPEVTQEESDSSSCGEGPVDAHHELTRTAYLGTFLNNRLQTVRSFPEWYLERVAR